MDLNDYLDSVKEHITAIGLYLEDLDTQYSAAVLGFTDITGQSNAFYCGNNYLSLNCFSAVIHQYLCLPCTEQHGFITLNDLCDFADNELITNVHSYSPVVTQQLTTPVTPSPVKPPKNLDINRADESISHIRDILNTHLLSEERWFFSFSLGSRNFCISKGDKDSLLIPLLFSINLYLNNLPCPICQNMMTVRHFMRHIDEIQNRTTHS